MNVFYYIPPTSNHSPTSLPVLPLILRLLYCCAVCSIPVSFLPDISQSKISNLTLRPTVNLFCTFMLTVMYLSFGFVQHYSRTSSCLHQGNISCCKQVYHLCITVHNLFECKNVVCPPIRRPLRQISS